METEVLNRSSYPKAVVVHAGSRDHYQLPLALHERGLLEAFVTDMYFPADRSWFLASLGRLLPNEIVAKKFCPELGSELVKISRKALGTFVLMKAAPRLNLHRYFNKVLSKKVRRTAEDENASLFCYSYYASEAFKESDGRLLPYRFLFQLHPNPHTVRNILEEEIERVPWAKSSLQSEYELSIPEQDFYDLCNEPQLANGWVTASSYTAKTLSDSGIRSDHIHVVPYGVDSEKFAKRLRPPSKNKLFTAIFVGSMVQRKGLSYFLDAVRMLKSKNIRVLLCGRGVIDENLLSQYSDLNLEIKVGLPAQELIRQFHESDVFVLPSLAEGFAHVILEAMSCGLPVITTSHTCAPDIISEGQHGFIIPIRNAVALAEKLSWGMDHRDDLAAMGEASAVLARTFTWERFRTSIGEAYKNMIRSVR